MPRIIGRERRSGRVGPFGKILARVTNPRSTHAALLCRDPLPLILLVMTGTTGLVDAVSYLGLGRVFTANMTGNVVFLGFAAVGVKGLSVARSLVSLAAFLV